MNSFAIRGHICRVSSMHYFRARMWRSLSRHIHMSRHMSLQPPVVTLLIYIYIFPLMLSQINLFPSNYRVVNYSTAIDLYSTCAMRRYTCCTYVRTYVGTHLCEHIGRDIRDVVRGFNGGILKVDICKS